MLPLAGGGPQDRNTIRIGSLEPKLEIYPNPFQNHLVIKFQIPNTNLSTRYSLLAILRIYDATGRLVKSFSDIQCNAVNSVYSVLWFGDDDSGCRLPAGVYFVCLKSGSINTVRQIVMLK